MRGDHLNSRHERKAIFLHDADQDLAVEPGGSARQRGAKPLSVSLAPGIRGRDAVKGCRGRMSAAEESKKRAICPS